MKKLVVFTGAGISQESGIKTFRDSGGLWEDYNISDVCSPDAWKKDPELVLDFYNKRRKQALKAKPNRAHEIIAELEKHFDVQIITQNIDDLHERAGSTNVLHLHGEITKARSIGTGKVNTIGNKSIFLNDLCDDGHQLRPHIVWFGEDVPNMLIAEDIVKTAAIFLIIGSSLNVYPAAGLVYQTPEDCPKYLVDPSIDIEAKSINNLTMINEKATIGLAIVASILEKEYL